MTLASRNIFGNVFKTVSSKFLFDIYFIDTRKYRDLHHKSSSYSHYR